MLCVAGWAGAVALGLGSSAGALVGQVAGAGQPEVAQRSSVWGPIYGFAAACAGHVADGATVLLVDPTDAVQPPYPGAPADVDFNDANRFAYALAPRRVTLLGHPHGGWDPAAAGVPYVAVWQQQAWRTEPARAAAGAAAATLASAPSAVRVCDYTAPGVRGSLFAIAGAGGAGAPVDLRGAGSWGDYPPTLLGLACLWLIGFALLRAVLAAAVPAGAQAALALPLGAFAASAELLVWSLAGLGWSAPALALPWLVLAGAVVWRERGTLRAFSPARAVRTAVARWRSLSADGRAAIGALVAFAGAIAVAAPLALPFSDGINFYYSKAKLFFLDGGVIPYELHSAGLPLSAPAHPPLVPLAITWLYLFQGHVSEHPTMLLWPALYASLLGVFYHLVRRLVGGRTAAWYTLAVALTASGLATTAIVGSYADLPLALDLLAACGLLAVQPGRPRPATLATAGLFLAAGAFTKEEGLVLAVAAIAAYTLVALVAGTSAGRSFRQRLSGPAGVAATFAGASLPLLWLRLAYPQPETAVSGHLHLSTLIWTLQTALVGLAERAALRWYPVLAVVAAAAVGLRAARRAPAVDRGLWFLVAFLVAAGGVYWAAMVADPLDLNAELSRTSGRLLNQVLAIPFLAAAWLLPEALRAARGLLFPAPPGPERVAAEARGS